MTEFTILGKPHAKQRPRMTRGGRVYTPQATVAFEKKVAQCAALYISEPLTGPVRISISAIFEPPKSWSKKRREAAMGEPHTQRPDIDNVAKGICDGLNGVAFVDDAQVYEIWCEKRWGWRAETVVYVHQMGSGDDIQL